MVLLTTGVPVEDMAVTVLQRKSPQFPQQKLPRLLISRYGLYSPGNTDGASQYFDREFYDAIFGEDLTMIGDANGDSKSDNAGFISQSGGLRWCCYELNVLGDPTMDIWTAIPTDIVATFSTKFTSWSNTNYCYN